MERIPLCLGTAVALVECGCTAGRSVRGGHFQASPVSSYPHPKDSYPVRCGVLCRRPLSRRVFLRVLFILIHHCQSLALIPAWRAVYYCPSAALTILYRPNPWVWVDSSPFLGERILVYHRFPFSFLFTDPLRFFDTMNFTRCHISMSGTALTFYGSSLF